ncbi:MAG: thioredoxin-disulfide reductase [Lachnospiraceae bacterium]|nr:thioredoxin-disulfide reductase [Lachnospiraceae bacterium]
MEKIRDLIIIGAGPAGLTAAIYAKRAGFDTLVIDETGMGGGQIVNTYEVDNYPGLIHINGFDMGMKFKEHATEMGTEFADVTVTGVTKKDDLIYVYANDAEYVSKALIIATGAKHRALGIPGEEELRGMGVSYCATCDGAFFRKKVCAVVGGGDVALEDALFLAKGCSKVYLIHRRDEFRGAKVLADKVKETENIEIVYDSRVTEIIGEGSVNKIKVENIKSGSVTELDINGIFIAVGMDPNTELFKDVVELDKSGYIKAGEDCITSTEGIFAAGDLRTKKLRQVITAAADGANAITSVSEYFNNR